MDRILIRDLLVRCIVGIDEAERRERQDVLVNVALEAELRPSAEADRFDEGLDYRMLKKRIVAAVEESRFFLLEALAERVARLCLEGGRFEQVQVTVDKPGALRFARSVAVEITRRRGS